MKILVTPQNSPSTSSGSSAGQAGGAGFTPQPPNKPSLFSGNLIRINFILCREF